MILSSPRDRDVITYNVRSQGVDVTLVRWGCDC
jgi:hypothetical protein